MDNIISAWCKVPSEIDRLVDRLSDDAFETNVKGMGLTVREAVHHLVEANIVAASMIIAALGASGANYDWSWLWSGKEWSERLGYSSVPIEPALETLRGLTSHISNIVAVHEDGLEREIWLTDLPGAEKYSKTVGNIIRDEIDHAAEHLEQVRSTISK